MKSWATAVLLCAACASSGGEAPRERLIDLSHSFDSDTIYWPTEEGFVHERGFAGVTDAGYYYSAHRFRGAEHGGTHLDAPGHFSADGRSVEAIPLDDLIGPAVVIDVAALCAEDRNHQIDIADLSAWEERHGKIPEAAIVLLNSDFARFWPDRVRYMGTDERGQEGVAKLQFPGLHPEAAAWLVKERRIRAVGIDTPSIDHGPSKDFAAHVVLAGANTPIFENLASLAGLPARGFRVVALPMKIRGGSGAPLRIVALVPGR